MQIELEKKAQQILGWTPQEIARASTSQLQTALKTGKTPLPIRKEPIVNLECFGSAISVKTTNNNNNNNNNNNALIQKLQQLKSKCNEKIEFKASKMTLEPFDLNTLDKAINKDNDDILKVNKEITQCISDLNVLILDKKDLLSILEPDDNNIPQIKLRIEQLQTQMDLLKNAQKK